MSTAPSRARALVLILGATVAGVLVLPELAAAHTHSYTVSCSGLTVRADAYQPDESNSVTVTINGTSQTTVFGASYEQFFPFQPDQDNQWSYAINAPGAQWDFANSGSEPACVVTTTTPPSTTTEVSSTIPTTTTPPTSVPATTTEPTTSAPTTTEAASTVPTTTDSTATNVPTTDAPTTTNGPSTTGPTDSPTTTNGSSTTDPTNVGGGTGTLPETGGNVPLPIAIGIGLLLVGAAAQRLGRRQSPVAD